jgi:hypothetical protein
MSTIQGWYYLHENKELIYKNNPDAITDIRDSDLCHSAWPWDGSRQSAWTILVEGLALGANPERIKELAGKWGCNDNDVINYAACIGVELGVDGNQKTATRKDFVNIQESSIGFGVTYLEAMAALCKDLGYTGGKMWNHTFESLVAVNPA